MLKQIILYIVLLLSFLGLIYSIYKIVGWYIDNKNTKEQIEKVEKYIEESEENTFAIKIDFASLLEEKMKRDNIFVFSFDIV